VSVCGDFGGVTAKGEPCRRASDGLCAQHKDLIAQGSPFKTIRHQKKRAYLRALVETGGNMSRACELAEIDRSTPYTAQWKQDEEFQALLCLAQDMGADHLEAEMIRRAYDGVEEPVGFYKGEPSAYVRRYSDTLMIFALKAARPEKYAERQRIEHSGRDGGPIETRLVRVPVVEEDVDTWTTRFRPVGLRDGSADGNGNGRP